MLSGGVVWLLLLLQLPAGTTPASSVERPSVLVLFAEDPSQPATQAFEDGLQEAVATSGADAPLLYFEYLDATRFEDRRYREALRRFIADKYNARRIDLLVPVGQSAIEFFAATRTDFAPDVPVLYVATHTMTIDASTLLPGAAGLDFRYNFSEGLQPILTVLPDTRHVALISGSSALERARAAGSLEAVRRAGLDDIDLSGLTLPAVLMRVAALPEHTVVFISGPLLDGRGRATPASTLCAAISSASTSPTFMVAATQLVGCGVTGGRMRNFTTMGRMTGERSLAALRRFTPDVRLVPTPQFTSLLFDARELERWRIDEARLPAGSTVHFRPPSLWRDYRREMLIVFGGLVVQMLLILGLLYERGARVRAERDSRRNLALAAHVDRRVAMATLTGSVAHELSQPLGSILHNAEAADRLLASNRATTEDLREILRDIRTEDARAAQIVERHRTMLKTHDLEKRPLDLYAIVRESLALMRHDAEGRQVRIDSRLPPTPCPVVGDQVLLQQVVVNLVMNAMDALADTPPARRRIIVGNAIGPGGVEIVVRDTGPGLPAALNGHLFEPFVTTKSTGLGIGLSIVRSIVEAHGGTIEARNAPEGGAVFRFTLPCSVTPPEC